MPPDDEARPPRSPLLLCFYCQFLASENSAAFIRAVATHYTPAALERLAGSADRVTRRAAVLALGLIADYTANPVLGRALTDQDRAVRMLAENGLRAIWRRQGSESQRRQIERLIRLNRSGEYEAAIALAGALVQAAPWIAEAWRRRGAAYYHQHRRHAALGDFRQTLELNPYHFDAAVGMAQCHLALENPTAALACFEQALQINPNLEGVRVQAHYLQRSLGRRR